MTNIGYKFYYLFIIGNFTNAVFFYLLLPETARRPLEEMNYLFANAPWIVAGKANEGYGYQSRDLEERVGEIRTGKGRDMEIEKAGY